jgi:hypothetical protein
MQPSCYLLGGDEGFGMTCNTMNPLPVDKYTRPPNPRLWLVAAGRLVTFLEACVNGVNFNPGFFLNLLFLPSFKSQILDSASY